MKFNAKNIFIWKLCVAITHTRKCRRAESPPTVFKDNSKWHPMLFQHRLLYCFKKSNKLERPIPTSTQCFYGTKWSDLSTTLNLSASYYNTNHAWIVTNNKMTYIIKNVSNKTRLYLQFIKKCDLHKYTNSHHGHYEINAQSLIFTYVTVLARHLLYNNSNSSFSNNTVLLE